MEEEEEENAQMELEAQAQAQTQTQTQTQGRSKGSVAEAGIIQYVEVFNFMCHKYLACGWC